MPEMKDVFPGKLTTQEVRLLAPGALEKFPGLPHRARFYVEGGLLYAQTSTGKVLYWSFEDREWFDS